MKSYKKLLAVFLCSLFCFSNTCVAFATTVSGNDIPAVINETIVDIPQVTPSSTATVTISLIETLSSDSAKFRLDYDLGTYTHQSGEARNEYPVSLFIESISWDKESFIIATYDYDNLVGSSSGSFEFTLNNLVNDTYTFYVKGISDSKYYGTFTVDFVVDDLTSMAQGIVIYSDEVPVVTFTGYPDSSVADGTVVTMTMNTGELPCTMRMNGRTLGNSAYGTSFEFTVSRNDTYYYDAISQSGVVTKGTLVIDFFDESIIAADDPLSSPLLDSASESLTQTGYGYSYLWIIVASVLIFLGVVIVLDRKYHFINKCIGGLKNGKTK